MILYHGSFIEINKPDLKHSRPNVDFGKGFYTVNLRNVGRMVLLHVMNLMKTIIKHLKF